MQHSRTTQTAHSWTQVQPEYLKKIHGICFDIDDTFSSEGKISSEAYQALWRLKEANLTLVPVTGRPAGWCDHIIRFWPVDAVVGENGAFIFYTENKVRKKIETLPQDNLKDSISNQEKLKKLSQNILKKFSEAKFASDQAYREYDLAVDICEDVPKWSETRIQELLDFCQSQGAIAKLSSIHVNIWFGNYHKTLGFETWMNQGLPGVSNSKKQYLISKENWIYLGDSPNDEPMFQAFPQSVGVANIKNFLTQMKFHPKWITSFESGKGFVEVADKILEFDHSFLLRR